MEASIKIVSDQIILSEFTLPYENLNKTNIQMNLLEKYQLTEGYEISYIDADGDQITVQFDEDYQVARLTHQEITLNLNVKISNQNWLEKLQNKNKQIIIQQSSLVQSIQKSIKSNADAVPDLLMDYIQVTQSIDNKEEVQKAFPQFISNAYEAVVDNVASPQSSEQLINQVKIQSLQIAHSQQNLISPQIKRTQTQTSQLQSNEEIQIKQIKQQKKIIDTFSFERQFLQEQIQTQPNDILESKTISKPKEKKKKQIYPKPEKKRKSLTEKDIKKLIKKQVFKLLPQISQKIKFDQQADESEPQNSIKLKQLNKIQSFKCSDCSQELRIPFYINSIQGIKLCKQCEQQDQSAYSLVKIRDQKMLEDIVWAQPLCSVLKLNTKKVNNDTQLYQELKRQFLAEIKEDFDMRINSAKQLAKKQKKQKNRNEAQKKQQTQIKQESLI